MGSAYTIEDCGCYLDGAGGDWSGRLIGLASDHGMDTSGMCEGICECDDAWCVQACEDWLNDNVPVEGAYWGARDGDFGLWSVEED